MNDTSHRDYRRRHPVTQITERRVVRTVTGLRRRVRWRLRELGYGMGKALRMAGSPMRKDSMWHTIARGRMDIATFKLLTEMLRMDEVDGWNRPWPKLPPARERGGLVEDVIDRLTAEGPGEEQETDGS